MITETTDGVNINGNQLSIDCITSNQDKFQLDSDGNLTVNSITTIEGSIGPTMNFDSIYPIGSIYMNTTNVNPSTLFGGTWEQIQDRFLLGTSNTYQVGSIGGEEYHRLTESEMPNHAHEMYECNPTTAGGWTPNGGNNGTYQNLLSYVTTVKQGYQGMMWMSTRGGNQPHNNMPPYLAVYIWKRIS